MIDSYGLFCTTITCSWHSRVTFKVYCYTFKLNPFSKGIQNLGRKIENDYGKMPKKCCGLIPSGPHDFLGTLGVNLWGTH